MENYQEESEKYIIKAKQRFFLSTTLHNQYQKLTEIFHSHIGFCYLEQQDVPSTIDDNLVSTINKRDHWRIQTLID